MGKYLYFRAGATLATDDDNAEGSNMVPASDLISMEATSDTTLTLRFKPRMNYFAAGGNAAADADNLTDSVVLTHGTNKQKAVMSALAKAINYGGADSMIVVADDVDSVYVSDDVISVATFVITAAQA
jgi:hypothetical protein|tara:strand:- start:38 stop:421 length:384 start_codon:yes stop_codon:yes gene_type:complete